MLYPSELRGHVSILPCGSENVPHVLCFAAANRPNAIRQPISIFGWRQLARFQAPDLEGRESY
jgi:hypothetical protein